MQNVDVVILGAGAAGMMCAIEAARRGRSVVLVDHAAAVGEKIRISGGGRCNFTNLHIAPDRFISANPRFALSALKRFTQFDFIAMVDAAGIAWHEKALGQLFCDGPATQINAMLVRAMDRLGVSVRLGTPVGAVRRGAGFEVETGQGGIRAASLVVATGGRSIPKMGATGFGYRLAEQFGVSRHTECACYFLLRVRRWQSSCRLDSVRSATISLCRVLGVPAWMWAVVIPVLSRAA